MFNPHDLTGMLGQANTGGVQSTLLVNSQGALVAFSGVGDSAVKVKATVASSIWWTYEHGKHNAANNDALQSIVVACDEGNMAIQRVVPSGLLLCIVSDDSVGLGLLKAKIDALVDFLKGPLSYVSIS